MKRIISYSFIFVLIDQIIKVVVSNMKNNIVIIKNFFCLTYVENTGAAFSILESKRIFLIIIGIGALYLIYKFLIKDKKLTTTETLIYSLLIGGIV